MALSATPAGSATLGAADLVGIWTARLDVGALFDVCIHIDRQDNETFVARLHGGSGMEEVPVWRDGERLRFQSTRHPMAWNGSVPEAGTAIEGFVKHASYVEHVVLTRGGCREHGSGSDWSAAWSVIGIPGESFPLDLYVNHEGDGVAGYLFFRQPTLPGFWTYGFSVQDNVVRFRDRNLGLDFEGAATRDTMQLRARAFGNEVPITFTRIDEAPDRQGAPRAAGSRRDAAPAQRDDGWRTGTAADAGLDTARLDAMVQAILSQELTRTHSVLIARHGALVFEEYFYGFTREQPHDTRSASKTVAAALVGAAIDKGHLPGVDVPVLSLLPRYREFDHWDPRKAQITIEDCLRMASGLDANDHDNDAAAPEWRYQSQTEQPDWVKYVLDAPMVADPGAQPVYGSANPLIVGGVLQAVLSEPLEIFAHRTLFAPMGIERYKLFLDPLDNVYLGGGMHLRPRDLARFGQMHLNGGTWNGTRILDEDYVRRSMAKHGHLDNVPDRNAYGYLWWHRDYTVDGKPYASIEARGAGGQYVCVVPTLDLVAVINSGNYRNGRFRQPEEIMERFIVPAAAVE